MCARIQHGYEVRRRTVSAQTTQQERHPPAAPPGPVAAMKWWGWGRDGISFSHDDKPDLAPFIRKHLGVDVEHVTRRAVAFEDVEVGDPHLPDDLRAELEAAVGHVSTEPLDRVVHARGKCLRDLVRHRGGDVGRVPDAVVRPGSEADVEALMRAALKHDCVLIPFGGGTNISGSLEPPEDDGRAIVSIDMSRMRRVLDIDEASGLARVQAGVFGPDLEEQLGARGWTAGHFPDSFSHSTLGGWIATRSSGMQSDKYGDIADLTRAVRVVTPAGILATRPIPAASTGPTCARWCSAARAGSGSSPRRRSTSTASRPSASSSATCSRIGRAR